MLTLLHSCLQTLKAFDQSGLRHLMPLVLGLFLVAGVLVMIQLVSPIAPFVYALF